MAEVGTNIGKLEEAALKRKERLKLLKQKGKNENDEKDNNSESQSLPKPLFRSYKPANEELNGFVLDPAKPGDVTAQVKDQLEAAKSEVVIDQLDVTSLAPRKPDWDLKRDVAKKLEKLERQTQKAIAELIRDRLKERKHDENLAAIVNVGATENT